VQRQHAPEQPRVGRQRRHGAAAQHGPALDRQQQPHQRAGQPPHAPMGRDIVRRVAGDQRAHQRIGLA